MDYASDLHLHSKYSRAVSQNMVLAIMAQWARIKGINILSTADWTHPLWFREIKNQLQEAGEGLFELKEKNGTVDSEKEPLFLLSVEISSIYSHNGKLRRIHNLFFAPSFETVEKINQLLVKRGCNISSDGRPIVGISSHDLLEMVLGIDKRVILIPCHAWTPHFGIYGSASGYDSIEESFSDLSKYIYGIETGISSDPWMNWHISELSNRSILSFSDAHSPAKMGRELTVFRIEKKRNELTYMDVGRAIARRSNGDKSTIAYTVEFYPEEGKYHYTGHRNCKVIKSPEEIKRDGPLCPVCKKRLTEGVLYRVGQLAKSPLVEGSEVVSHDELGVRWIKDPKDNHPPFVKLVPLNEIVAESLGSTVASEKVKALFHDICKQFGSELSVLLRVPLDEIARHSGAKLAEGVAKVRSGRIMIDPGYDGEYGKVKIWPASPRLGGNHQEGAEQSSNVDTQEERKEQLGLF